MEKLQSPQAFHFQVVVVLYLNYKSSSKKYVH